MQKAPDHYICMWVHHRDTRSSCENNADQMKPVADLWLCVRASAMHPPGKRVHRCTCCRSSLCTVCNGDISNWVITVIVLVSHQ